MPGSLVVAVRTTYTQTQMIQGFITGWQHQFGVYPKKESIGVLWSQDAVETGLTTSMWNNNIGNVKYVAAAGDNSEYMMLEHVWEIVNGHKVMFEPPNPATWFRSFPSLTQGIAFQMDFLKNHRYKAAWAAVESGSVPEFAHLLKIAGYYTAPESDYVAAMNHYYHKFMADKTFENIMATLTGTPVVVPTPPVVIEPQEPPIVEPQTPPNPAPPPVVVANPPTPVAPPNPNGGSVFMNALSAINAFIVNILKFGLKD